MAWVSYVKYVSLSVRAFTCCKLYANRWWAIKCVPQYILCLYRSKFTVTKQLTINERIAFVEAYSSQAGNNKKGQADLRI